MEKKQLKRKMKWFEWIQTIKYGTDNEKKNALNAIETKIEKAFCDRLKELGYIPDGLQFIHGVIVP